MIDRFDDLRKFAYDLTSLVDQNSELRDKMEKYRLKTAEYKAYFFGKSNLAKRLRIQIDENDDNRVGYFDGFSYSGKRADAKYRTLEDLLECGHITKEEYDFCNEELRR